MKENIIKVGIVQQACTSNREINIKTSVEGIKNCKKQGADLVVLQELHTSLYFCQTEDTDVFDLAKPIPGEDTELFSRVAKEHEVVLVTSLFERRAAGLYHNTAVVFEKDGSMAGKYRKMHIPDDPAYYEKFYFTPGDLDFTPIQTSVGKLGVLVCWDQWYPEAARLMALKGADILIYPTAIGWDSAESKEEQYRQNEAWKVIQRSHAIANGLPLVSVNRIGFEADPSGVTEGIPFWGDSFICGPQGEVLLQAPQDIAYSGVAEASLCRSEEVRRIWPFLRDRRIEAYQGLTKRYLD